MDSPDPEERQPDGSRVSDYDYHLPPSRIARYPADRRDESRLLVVPSEPGSARAGAAGGTPTPFRHLRFRDVGSLLKPGDLLVLNESRVRTIA